MSEPLNGKLHRAPDPPPGFGTLGVAFTADSTFVAAQRTVDTLMRAIRDHGCHVMMTPPCSRYGFEVSLSGTDDVIHHGEHPTDPHCALLIALAKFEAAHPRQPASAPSR